MSRMCGREACLPWGGGQAWLGGRAREGGGGLHALGLHDRSFQWGRGWRLDHHRHCRTRESGGGTTPDRRPRSGHPPKSVVVGADMAGVRVCAYHKNERMAVKFREGRRATWRRSGCWCWHGGRGAERREGTVVAVVQVQCVQAHGLGHGHGGHGRGRGRGCDGRSAGHWGRRHRGRAEGTREAGGAHTDKR